MTEILTPAEMNPTVAKSMARHDACAKPGSLGKSGVRIRPILDKKVPRLRRRKRDYRDVQFF